MAPHSSTLAWKIPGVEEPGRPQSTGSQRVGYNWATSLSLFTFMHWGRQWQPTPVFLPGESQRWGSLVGCRLGVAQSRTRLKRLSSSSSSILFLVTLSLLAQPLMSPMWKLRLEVLEILLEVFSGIFLLVSSHLYFLNSLSPLHSLLNSTQLFDLWVAASLTFQPLDHLLKRASDRKEHITMNLALLLCIILSMSWGYWLFKSLLSW